MSDEELRGSSTGEVTGEERTERSKGDSALRHHIHVPAPKWYRQLNEVAPNSPIHNWEYSLFVLSYTVSMAGNSITHVFNNCLLGKWRIK